MTLEEIFFVSQTIAAVAVVVSILYLAREIRQSEQTQRANMQRGRADRASRASLDVAHPALSAVWHKAMSPRPDLAPEEFTQWVLICRAMFLSGEDSFLQHKAGLLDDGAFASFVAGVHFYMTCPGMRAMWKVASAQFGEEFRAFVDELVAHPLLSGGPDAYDAWKAQVRIEIEQGEPKRTGA